ncbi:hypothetical protein PHMEG_00018067 [Phytophthora megakarya]|uniref:Transposase n=1 Tax=Phytophthora megakarya TaxID=4795 RepID=A0A225VV93_9STRA|nr:hypothetical protein PHMEG_00018067 [Phytophthora megakarya]
MANLPDVTRRAIVNNVLKNSKDGKVHRGKYVELARNYGCLWHTVEHIWKRYSSNVALGVLDGAPESLIKKKSGRKPYDRADLATKISALPMDGASVLPSQLNELGSPSLCTSFSTLKPVLSEEQRARRVSHTLSFLDEKTCEFEPMYDIVHIDEKWFHEDVDGRPYRLLPDEEPPQRHRRSKRHTPKTMFLAAVDVCCIYDYQRKTMFDDKLGIWPLVEFYTAQCNSRN